MSAPASPKTQRPWLLYLLECRGDKLYAGISPDPEARFRQHQQGTGAKYTRANPPLRILAAQVYADRSAASAAEHALKQLRRDAKLLWARERAWPLRSKLSGVSAAKKAASTKQGASAKQTSVTGKKATVKKAATPKKKSPAKQTAALKKTPREKTPAAKKKTAAKTAARASGRQATLR